MQAVSQSQLAATYMGVRTRSNLHTVWAFAGASLGGGLCSRDCLHPCQHGVLGLKAIPQRSSRLRQPAGAHCRRNHPGVCESLAGFYLPKVLATCPPISSCSSFSPCGRRSVRRTIHKRGNACATPSEKLRQDHGIFKDGLPQYAWYLGIHWSLCLRRPSSAFISSLS